MPAVRSGAEAGKSKGQVLQTSNFEPQTHTSTHVSRLTTHDFHQIFVNLELWAFL